MSTAAAVVAFAAVAYISTNTYLTITTPTPNRKKTMTEQTTLTVARPPATLDDIRQMLEELLAARVACLGCSADAHRALAAGQEPGNVNLANVIVSGNGQCWQHVQFVDRPLAPGQRPSGLLVPGT